MITAADIQTIRDNDPGAVLPGIDTMTGNPYATSSLLDVTKISQNTKAPYYYSPSANIVYVTQAGAVLSGINFGSATVHHRGEQRHDKGLHILWYDGFLGRIINASGVSGATVENCTFTGSKSPTEKNVWISSVLGITIEDNTFLNSPADYDRHSARRRHRQLLVRRGICDGSAWRCDLRSGLRLGPSPSLTISLTRRSMPVRQGYSNTDLRITDEFGNVERCDRFRKLSDRRWV